MLATVTSTGQRENILKIQSENHTSSLILRHSRAKTRMFLLNCSLLFTEAEGSVGGMCYGFRTNALGLD